MNLTLQTIPSTLISELLASSDLDGVVLDTEHGHFNNETLYNCIQVITLYNKKCFVRFTDLNKQLVRMCLDAGIDGVIFSTVEAAEVGRAMLDYCRYPHHGGVRGCGLVRENKWGKLELGKHKPIVVAQIETKAGVENLDSICDCDFDYFVIGPYDLSASLGCTARWNDQLYVEYLNKIYQKIPLSKLGSFLPTQKDIENFTQSNRSRPDLLIMGMDTDFIKQGLNNIK
jgi:2-keto-3-deoxy-L-rhamnonate aldolase RhmA